MASNAIEHSLDLVFLLFTAVLELIDHFKRELRELDDGMKGITGFADWRIDQIGTCMIDQEYTRNYSA